MINVILPLTTNIKPNKFECAILSSLQSLIVSIRYLHYRFFWHADIINKVLSITLKEDTVCINDIIEYCKLKNPI